MRKITVSVIAAVFGVFLIGTTPAHATYDPCSDAAMLNSAGGNFGSFVTDEGPAPVNECVPQQEVVEAEPVTVVVEEANTPEVPQPVQPETVEAPETQEVETAQEAAPVAEPEPKPKKKKKKKGKKDKGSQQVTVSTEPEVTAIVEPVVEEEIIDPAPEVTDEPFTGIVVEQPETELPQGQVQAASVPASNEFPWLHVYGTAAVSLAAAAFFVAARRKSS